MSKERAEAYVEVLEVLNYMDNKYVEKIPLKLIEFFKKNCSKEYKFILDKSIPFEEQKFKDITINTLAMLNLNYWCENEEHKEELMKRYYDNEVKYQQELSKKYSTEHLFKKKKKVVNKPVQENNFLEYYEEPKWYILLYENIHEFVLKLLRKIFN